jgi:hypothetical protein
MWSARYFPGDANNTQNAHLINDMNILLGIQKKKFMYKIFKTVIKKKNKQTTKFCVCELVKRAVSVVMSHVFNCSNKIESYHQRRKRNFCRLEVRGS